MAPQTAPDLTASKIVARYRDAYRIARIFVGLGKTLKIIGLILGAICLAAGLITGAKTYSSDGERIAIYGLLAGIVAWFLFWAVGVVVSSLGQQLRASLDGAVNTSPFLSNQQRLEAMGI